ncbi:predicted protein [Scheffersomyces stipitis CBS 6054]|uniref:DUF605-domain-containing protein n=1 Tax=Scheffersomyces stipitis (strain ATCC 58785 / CBS 6054 / NBRC 10063 / NRRL Y-11545) TaxID=322104 RepID=A3GHR7_PICST|nr:predicted protein [Scheffersomyces stipitis CBS 6054]EAZ63100.2 predicted protein [Scheffersomyces stipitis CBS 6054]
MSSQITVDSVPEALKADKSVSPFIARSVELESVNPVVSYYCKFYVLEYILSNKLHTKSEEIQTFTIALLDTTEAIKKSTEDESVHKVLNDRSLSLSMVLSFSYKLFNSCLESLSNFTRSTNKPALVGKFRATLNFLSLLSIFTSNDDSTVDWNKLTGGKASDAKSFEALNKEKIKVLKYQLSKIIKDEIEYKDEPTDLELEEELNKDAPTELVDLSGLDDVSAKKEDEGQELDTFKLPGAPSFLPDVSTSTNEANGFPSTPLFLDDDDIADAKDVKATGGDADVSLPGVPHFPPEDSDSNNEVKLPGAPKYLPDDDITHINKSSSIQVFPPDPEKKRTSSVSSSRKPSTTHSSAQAHHHHITKENIAAIVDTSESISKVQKHAKFAISALNYDDIDTAEKELLQGLELIRLLKAQGGIQEDY